MNTNRRSLLKATGALGMLVAAGLLSAKQALAYADPRAGFEAKTLAEMLQIIGGTTAMSTEVMITAPDIAENGAVVPVGVISTVPGTQQIYIFAEKNPTPLAAIFNFPEGTETMVQTRIKLGQSTDVVVIVKANDKLFTASKEVKVTLGGCGG
jgi:sulfur-oxidizing protein SoxY